MAAKKSAKKGGQKSVKKASADDKATKVFTAAERAAMRERAAEMKAAARRGGSEDDESAVLEKIAGMAAADRAMAERIHALIKASAPELAPRLWYGMPAYAKDGNVVCHFQPALKFKTRYSTLGFSDKAALDEGEMWPVAFALKDLTAGDEAKITALLKKAVS